MKVRKCASCAAPHGAARDPEAEVVYRSGGEGWVSYLSTLSGRENLPRIRAADGRAGPALAWSSRCSAGSDCLRL